MSEITTPSEPLDIAAVRARCEAATKGPWEIAEHSWAETSIEGDGNCVALIELGYPTDSEEGDDDEAESGRMDADAQFIAHARTDLPHALDEITALRARLARYALMEERGWSLEPEDCGISDTGDHETMWYVYEHHMSEPHKRLIGSGLTHDVALYVAKAQQTPDAGEA